MPIFKVAVKTVVESFYEVEASSEEEAVRLVEEEDDAVELIESGALETLSTQAMLK